jgi:hypothetical protein
MSLHTEDATFYYPKLGMAHGKIEIGLLAQGFGLEMIKVEHNNIVP